MSEKTAEKLFSRIMRRSIRFAMRFFMWLSLVSLTALALVHLVFWGFLTWLGTGGGQNFLQAQLGKELEGSGYRVDIDGPSYVLPTRMYLGGVKFYEGERLSTEISGFAIRIDPFPLDQKILKLAAHVDALIVHSVDSTKPSDPVALQPVVLAPSALPDLYFKKIIINDISIDELKMSGMTLSPALSGAVSFENDVVQVDLALFDRIKKAAFIPHEVRVSGAFNTNEASLALDALMVTAAEYAVQGTGQAIFNAGEKVSLDLNIKTDQVEGLSPIKVQASLENIEGLPAQFLVQGVYLNKPVEMQTVLRSKGSQVDLRDIILKLPEFNASGSVIYDTGDGVAIGQLQGRLNSLSPYIRFIGADHDIDPLRFTLVLAGGQNSQNIHIKTDTNRYENKAIGVVLHKLALDAVLNEKSVQVKSFTARDEKDGRINVFGGLSFEDLSVDARLNAKDIHALKNGMADGVIDMDLTVKGNQNRYDVSGKIAPQMINIRLPERMTTAIPSLNVTKETAGKSVQEQDIAKSVFLDVVLDAPSQIFVRGWGLDAEFGGKLEISGALDDARYEGSLGIIRGRYSDFGKNFKLPKGKLLFNGPVPPYPKLDILAQTKAGDITAKIAITGDAKKPELGFSSDPSMPEDEVLSYILFGKSMGKISPLQAVQLAQTLGRLSGNGGGLTSLNPIDTLRSATGLDDLRVETTEEGGANVGAGKYLADNVYLEFEAGSEEGSTGATIEVEVTPNITVESEVGQDAQGGAGVFWKWDY